MLFGTIDGIALFSSALLLEFNLSKTMPSDHFSMCDRPSAVSPNHIPYMLHNNDNMSSINRDQEGQRQKKTGFNRYRYLLILSQNTNNYFSETRTQVKIRLIVGSIRVLLLLQASFYLHYFRAVLPRCRLIQFPTNAMLENRL
jgi:hypothetical protein